jgi:hypothetical protein
MESNTKNLDFLWRPSRTAKELAICPRTLWALTNSGEIPCVRINRSVRYRPETIRAWLAERESSKN